MERGAIRLERCPVCRARLGPAPAPDEPCRRCGSDLSLVHHAYGRARALRDQARRALAHGSDRLGRDLARQAVELVDEPATRATLAAALVALGRPSAALEVLGVDRRGAKRADPRAR